MSIKTFVSLLALTAAIGLSAVCTSVGVQNIVVLLVTFPGVTLPTGVTPLALDQTFFGASGHSLDGYWRETSYGQASAAGTVYGTYTLSQAYTCSTADQMLHEAMSLAAAQGANFQNYTRVFLIYPNMGCSAGFAQVGCGSLTTPSGIINASWSQIQADYSVGDIGVYLAAHEGGHNMGLQHSGTLTATPDVVGPLASPGTIDEFNDNFTSMGSQTLGQYAAPHKAQLGWIAPSTNYQVVQGNGVWSLAPYETSPEGLEALKIQRGTGNNAWLWVEYRQPIGDYDSTVYFQQPSGGAFIHYEDSTNGAFTRILNFQPALNSWYAPMLPVGQTWTDPYSNVSITVQSMTASALTIAVNYSGPPPPPPLSITPTSVTLQKKQKQQFTASLSPVTWSISPIVGTISSSGLYTAPANIRTLQNITVTAINGMQTATASITLHP